VGHSGAYHTDTIMDRKHQLIMIFLVQHADWAPECNNIVPAFQKAAISLWGNK
jgi:hypothetical protein